jgi:hypothetical protein
VVVGGDFASQCVQEVDDLPEFVGSKFQAELGMRGTREASLKVRRLRWSMRRLRVKLGNTILPYSHAQAFREPAVVYFPPGVYRFRDTLRLLDGIILRGAAPTQATAARDPGYTLATQFEFPRYEFHHAGQGADIASAFKGIVLDQPALASNCGIVQISLQRGHIHFGDDGSEAHRAGHNRVVYGCILRNAAVADPALPDRSIGQHAWQRFTHRHFAAIDVKAEANILVANNRLPPSGEDNFVMDGYVLLDSKKQPLALDGVVFDYDNRPGLYVNHYALGGAGGNGPDGTPETHPFGFRTGIVIRDNYIFNTGRMGIGFSGDGVLCQNNTVRIPDNIWRPTATGRQLTTGASTNDNRAVEMRGWRWTVDGNDYEVHRNWAADRKYKINDGEGLMHEDHVNATVQDCVLTNNRGNTYLSIYKTAGIDGLRVEGNDIRLGDGKQAIAGGSAIYVSADRNSGRYPCRNVAIENNTVSGGGILLSGSPAEQNRVRHNRCLGTAAPIKNAAQAVLEGNSGFA